MSDLYRIVRDEDGLHVDLMATIHGIRSFAGVRDRARRLEFGGAPLLVAALEDIIRSKRADVRVIAPCWTSWRPVVKKLPSRRLRLAALARESDRAIHQMIERWQRRPPAQRTHFLRKRAGQGRTAL